MEIFDCRWLCDDCSLRNICKMNGEITKAFVSYAGKLPDCFYPVVTRCDYFRGARGNTPHDKIELQHCLFCNNRKICKHFVKNEDAKNQILGRMCKEDLANYVHATIHCYNYEERSEKEDE